MYFYIKQNYCKRSNGFPWSRSYNNHFTVTNNSSHFLDYIQNKALSLESLQSFDKNVKCTYVLLFYYYKDTY